jgi:uncharacterized protein (UPF0212 family)
MSNHKCDVPDIDYSNADHGHIRCRACGRDWHLAWATNEQGQRRIVGWRPDPKPTRGGSWS